MVCICRSTIVNVMGTVAHSAVVSTGGSMGIGEGRVGGWWGRGGVPGGMEDAVLGGEGGRVRV